MYFCETERGAEREGDRVSETSYMLTSEPNAELKLMNHEIMTWAEVIGCSTDSATQELPCLILWHHTLSFRRHWFTEWLKYYKWSHISSYNLNIYISFINITSCLITSVLKDWKVVKLIEVFRFSKIQVFTLNIHNLVLANPLTVVWHEITSFNFWENICQIPSSK